MRKEGTHIQPQQGGVTKNCRLACTAKRRRKQREEREKILQEEALIKALGAPQKVVKTRSTSCHFQVVVPPSLVRLLQS
jgi:hypothetical protein